jgi:hypothetical protein
MKQHTEQHLDKLAKKVIKSSAIESPSLDFTADVMKQVEQVSENETLTYKPLISKYGWLCIIAILVGVSVYMIVGNIDNPSWLGTIDFDIVNNKIPALFSGLKISKTFLYAIGFFGLVFFIQIPLMKHVINKRLEL